MFFGKLQKKVSIPELVTTAVSSITTTSVTSGGTITDDGGATIIASGVCYSTSSGPTIDGYKTLNGPAETSFIQKTLNMF